LNQPSFKLGKCGEYVENQLAGCGCGVNHPIGNRTKADTPLFQFFDHVDQVTHGPTEPVQPPDNKRITLSQSFVASNKAGTVFLRTRDFVAEQMFFLDAVLTKRVNLKAQFLIGRADSGITNKARIGLAFDHRRLLMLKKGYLQSFAGTDKLSANFCHHAAFWRSRRAQH
jgi:hypothetical protein